MIIAYFYKKSSTLKPVKTSLKFSILKKDLNKNRGKNIKDGDSIIKSGFVEHTGLVPKTIVQVIRIQDSQIEEMIKIPVNYIPINTWKKLSTKEKIIKHFESIAHDINADSVTYEIIK